MILKNDVKENDIEEKKKLKHDMRQRSTLRQQCPVLHKHPPLAAPQYATYAIICRAWRAT